MDTGKIINTEILKILNERGLVYQMTDEETLGKTLSREQLTFYVGFDATAESLHLGNLIPLMVAKHLQNAGHKPVILVGEGTALIGDPSERNTERAFQSKDTVSSWAKSIEAQLSGFLRFDDSLSGAIILNNAEWLCKINYINFLRDIGRHFSVNRMLSAESVKLRLETGMSFLEFNYMLLQAYDFLHLFRNMNCRFQLGGSDQWGNIVAGVDLIRRVESTQVFGMTCPLVTTTTGEKMSKSASGGTIWLDPDLTNPYDYYQFWINVDDRDVIYFLKLFTNVSMDRIEILASLTGAQLREAKELLAFEATSIAHGKNNAEKARIASNALFRNTGDTESVPTLTLSVKRFTGGVSFLELFVETGLCSSRSEVRRLSRQGGLYVNNQRLSDSDKTVDRDDIKNSSILLRTGKKKYYRIKLDKKG